MKRKKLQLPPIDENGKEIPTTVNQWLNMRKPQKGFSILNAKYKKAYRTYYRQLSMWAKMLYILGIRCGERSMIKMMYSARDQADYCSAVLILLEENEVLKEHMHFFEDDLKTLRSRMHRIELIANENIYLTKYWPFWQEFKNQNDFENTPFDDFSELANKWNEQHKEEVEAHMEAVAPEIERHQNFVKGKAQKIKEEKQATKEARKKENAEIREMKENAKKHRAEYRKVERSFERYYQGRA